MQENVLVCKENTTKVFRSDGHQETNLLSSDFFFFSIQAIFVLFKYKVFVPFKLFPKNKLVLAN